MRTVVDKPPNEEVATPEAETSGEAMHASGIDWPVIGCRRLILHISEDIAFASIYIFYEKLNSEHYPKFRVVVGCIQSHSMC